MLVEQRSSVLRPTQQSTGHDARMLPRTDMQQASTARVQLDAVGAELCCAYLAAIMEDLQQALVFQQLLQQRRRTAQLRRPRQQVKDVYRRRRMYLFQSRARVAPVRRPENGRCTRSVKDVYSRPSFLRT